MPPLKEATKRKTTTESKSIVAEKPKAKEDVQFKEMEDLLGVFDDQENDITDSEGEIEPSDEEQDEPIFNSDDEDEDDLSFASSSPGEDSEEDEGHDSNLDDDSESGFEQTSSDAELDSDNDEKKEKSIIDKMKKTLNVSSTKISTSEVKNQKSAIKTISENKPETENEYAHNKTRDTNIDNQQKKNNLKNENDNLQSIEKKLKKKKSVSMKKINADIKEKPNSASKNSVISKNKVNEKYLNLKTDNNSKNNSVTNNKGSKDIIKNKRLKVKSKISNETSQKSDESQETSTSTNPIIDKGKKGEYENGDTSDEEDRRNTVGNIPLEWYNDYPHIGYDLDGKQILKPTQRDQIEDFLKRCEDPNFWRTVKDPTTGQDVVLSKNDLEVIGRMRQGKTPDASYNDYPVWIEWFSSEVLQTPIVAQPEHKRSFLPSALEQRQVNKLVHALRAGWIKTRKEDYLDRQKKKEKRFYMLWSTDDQAEQMRRIKNHIPPPKRSLPGHAESYNPPPEYLLDAKEMKQWKKLESTPWKRKYSFLPQKFGSLREVPAYSRFTRERFLRCLDLYLAPRAIKMRLTIDPEQLVPKLPNPQDLQPFPTQESMVYRGHEDMVRCIDIHPTGQYLFSGCEDGSVKIWEVNTGRCLKTIQLNDCIKCLKAAPGESLSLLAVACGKRLLLISPGSSIGDHKVAERTDELLAEPPDNSDVIVENRISAAIQWDTVSKEDWELGIRISITHFKELRTVCWHGRGDYVCVVLPEGLNRSVVIHQISRRRSQLPFSKSKGLIQCATFHPIRPYLFVATQKVVRIYDLVKQELVKKLLTSAQWISTMAVHPAGDNLLVATYDKKMMWFDLDLSTKPYQILRLHGAAVRGVAFHKRYPLFASGSDDRKLIVSHGMVYNDLLQNPLIVPLKQIQTHEKHEDFGILDVVFHPYQPWVFSAGADATIRLYT